MNDFDPTAYRNIGERLMALSARYSALLPVAEYAAIDHYIGNDEYEMGCELLCLQIVKRQILMPTSDADNLFNLGQLLRLNEETVFAKDSWNVFQNYIRPQS